MGQGSGADWFSLAIAVISMVSVIVGKVLSKRAKDRAAQTEEGLAALQWAKEFEARTKGAETKASAAETKATETERRSIETERKLARAEARLDDMADLVRWVAEVIDLAHDATDADRSRLVTKINGGPPAYHRNR
jgi:hypothetical protein